jgi:peroxiredoxin
VLTVGDKAPSFDLDAIGGGGSVSDPWNEGQVVLAFFKTSCPVCKMVAPMLTKLAQSGVRVVAVGEDPPEDLVKYNEEQGQRVLTLTEPAPYRVSEAFGLEAVPTVFLTTWNELAATLGAEPLSAPDDGLRPFRPG